MSDLEPLLGCSVLSREFSLLGVMQWSWDVDRHDNIGKVLPVINNETPLLIAEIPFALVCLGTLGLVALPFLGHPRTQESLVQLEPHVSGFSSSDLLIS